MRAVAPELRTTGFVTLSGSTVTTADPETAKNYIDRMKAYIPAEVVAFFIFVNSLVIGTKLRVPAKPPAGGAQPLLDQAAPAVGSATVITTDGYVAIATLAVGVILSILYARFATKDGSQPWKVQAFVTALAFLVWSYALGGRGYEALKLDVVPSLAGLLMGTFTAVSGFIVPIKKA